MVEVATVVVTVLVEVYTVTGASVRVVVLLIACKTNDLDYMDHYSTYVTSTVPVVIVVAVVATVVVPVRVATVVNTVAGAAVFVDVTTARGKFEEQ